MTNKIDENDYFSFRFLEPTAESIQLEQKLDTLGEDLRRYMYNVMFNQISDRELLLRAWGITLPGIPQWQKIVLRAVAPMLQAVVTWKADISPAAVEEARRDLHRGMDEVKNCVFKMNSRCRGKKN